MFYILLNSDAIESMMYDHFSSNSNMIPDIIRPTSSISSSQIGSVQKRAMPIATKSETTANSQNSSGSKFISWMIPNKRTPTDMAADNASISSKKSSSSSFKDEAVTKKIDIDVKKLYEYATKDLHTFGYPPTPFTSVSDANNMNGNKISNTNTVVSATNTTTTSIVINNSLTNSTSSTLVASTTVTSINSVLDGNTGTSQKVKVGEIFDKNSSTLKPIEKDR